MAYDLLSPALKKLIESWDLGVTSWYIIVKNRINIWNYRVQ